MRDRFLRHLEAVREPLTAYVRSLLWNSSDLADALQSTLLTAFEKFCAFEEGTNFRAWVFQIATHTVFNLNRKHAPRDVPPPDLAESLEHEVAYDQLLKDPDVVLTHVDDEIRRAVRELTEPERAALLLVSVGGVSCREAASILDMPIGSVMGYLGRARVKLRSHLAMYARDRGLLKEAP